MVQYRVLWFCILIIKSVQNCVGYGTGNFVIKRISLCNPHQNYPLIMNFSVKTIGSKQYLDGDIIFAVDVDSNVRSNFSIESLIGKNYVHLFSITERSLCVAMHKYMGEFMYDLERSAQMMPGMCPIRKGRYHLHNFELNFNKIALQTFPFGILRFTEIAKPWIKVIRRCMSCGKFWQFC